MSTLANTDRKKHGDHEAYILQLPNELVCKILDLSIHSEFPPGTIGSNPRARSIIIGLLRVCRRFRTIVTPQLYSELHIVSIVTKEGFAFNKSASLLHRTLKHNSAIRHHCQKLAISLDTEQKLGFESSAEPQDSMFDLISWLSSTSQLCLTGHQTKSQGVQSTSLSMLIGRALDCLPKLTILRIHGTIFSLPSVLEGLGDLSRYNTNLSALEIDRITDTENNPQWQVLRGLEGTAPIKKLKLKHYGQTPEFLDALMKWPAMLQKLSFRPLCAWSTGRSGLFDNWSFAVLQPILEVQMANLRELAILDLDTGDIKNLDLTSFKMLEVLKLPSTLTGYDKEDIARLVCPNLRVFKWKVVTWDSEVEEQADDFGQVQEDWIRALVRVAVEREVKLKRVFIKFTPIVLGVLVNLDREAMYPWDRMANIGRDSEAYGVEIRHDPPTISRDEFLDICPLNLK